MYDIVIPAIIISAFVLYSTIVLLPSDILSSYYMEDVLIKSDEYEVIVRYYPLKTK